jgi:hypothetical protein
MSTYYITGLFNSDLLMALSLLDSRHLSEANLLPAKSLFYISLASGYTKQVPVEWETEVQVPA